MKLTIPSETIGGDGNRHLPYPPPNPYNDFIIGRTVEAGELPNANRTSLRETFNRLLGPEGRGIWDVLALMLRPTGRTDQSAVVDLIFTAETRALAPVPEWLRPKDLRSCIRTNVARITKGLAQLGILQRGARRPGMPVVALTLTPVGWELVNSMSSQLGFSAASKDEGN